MDGITVVNTIQGIVGYGNGWSFQAIPSQANLWPSTSCSHR